MRFWHFADNDQLFKLQPLLEYFNAKMWSVYTSDKQLSLDESMVLWKGRVMFRLYIKNKQHMEPNCLNFASRIESYYVFLYILVKVTLIRKRLGKLEM